jgi:hemerythrin
MDRPFLQWIDGYAVGHEALDAEHRRLVALINEIHGAEFSGDAGQIGHLLDAFWCATLEHLSHENTVMRELKDQAARAAGGQQVFLEMMSTAVISEHIAEHVRGLQHLDAIVCAFHSAADVAVHQVGDALRGWFVEHAVKYDAHLKAVFQAM